MKILLIRSWATYLEVQDAVYNVQELGLAKALVRRGHVCDLLFYTDREEKVVTVPMDGEKQVQVFYRHARVFLKNALFENLPALLERYEIYQTGEYSTFLSLRLAKQYPGKTVVYHGPYACDFNRRYNSFCKVFDLFAPRAFRKSGTHFIAKSRLARDFLTDRGIPAERIAVLGVGMDLGVFSRRVQGEAPEAVKKLNAMGGKRKLLYVGRFEPRRNIEFLLELVAELRKDGLEVCLVHVGGREGEYARKCMEAVEQLNLEGTLCWLGELKQRELAEVYCQCDLFLLPTHYEIFGMALMEAMAMGLPVLTTANGGSDLLIEDGTNGYVLPLEMGRWRETVHKLDQDKSLRKRIGENARQTIQANFTWDALAGRFEAVYQELAG